VVKGDVFILVVAEEDMEEEEEGEERKVMFWACNFSEPDERTCISRSNSMVSFSTGM